MVTLADIADNKGARKNRTRVGRGIGSGKGKTAGRGHKGQKSRSGVSTLGLEGGQTPIFMRIPKRGFNNIHAKDVEAVNITVLEDFISRKRLGGNKTITREMLLEVGLIKRKASYIKILAKSTDIKAKINVEANLASKGAVAAIEKAGGKIQIVELNTNTPAKAEKKDAPAKAEVKKAKTEKKTPAKKAEEK